MMAREVAPSPCISKIAWYFLSPYARRLFEIQSFTLRSPHSPKAGLCWYMGDSSSGLLSRPLLMSLNCVAEERSGISYTASCSMSETERFDGRNCRRMLARNQKYYRLHNKAETGL